MMIKTTRDFIKERDTQGENISLINLGCARNLVDAQTMMSRLKRQGHRFVDLGKSQVAIVNTCAFVDDAKKESIDTIIELLEMKRKGKLKKVIVAGCLAERFGPDLAKEFKDIDAIVGIQKLDREKIPSDVLLTPKHYAYVKICESCYNRCSFCVIPKIKGKFVSRTIESILEEIKILDHQGVKEINLIGQDITAYGVDLYHKLSLARLLKEMVKAVKNIQWIRLLYAFPAHVTDELIDVMAANRRICRYVDMPLQHISDHLLLSQNRNITTKQTKDLVQKIRTKMKNVNLRTTFIVGLPGETNDDFKELLDYVKAACFEKLGVFIYSREEGTEAYGMRDQVSDALKRKRMDALMKTQQEISRAIQGSFVGKELTVMIDEQEKDKNVYIARSEYDAPDVDGIVYVHTSKKLKPGDFVQVKITDAYEYDLVSEPV